MEYKTKIVCGFPGVGKSYIKNLYGSDVSDSDSSTFDKSQFPENYIKHIKSLMGSKKIIMVSTHPEVLSSLQDENLDYILVHPDKSLKDEYIERYKKRGSPEAFINLLNNKWDSFMNDIEKAKPLKRVVLQAGEFLKDKIKD